MFYTVLFHNDNWLIIIIIREISLIQIAKKRLLRISQISLITSVKNDWLNQWKDYLLIQSVKINWFNSEKYFLLVNEGKYKSLMWKNKIKNSENLTDSD